MATTETFTLKVDAKFKKAVTDGLAKIAAEGKKGAMAARSIDQNIKKISPVPLDRLAQAANRANGGLLNMVKNTTLMGYNLQGIVLVAVNKLRAGFVDMTDQFNRVIGQMSLLSGSAEEASRLTLKLQEAAVATGWSLDDMSSGMTKLHTGIKQYDVGADRAIELTKNFGLWMRAMGDEGKRVPKVLGNLVTMFQRSTLTLEKLETLLGRGRAEQFLGRIGENYLKIAKIDLAQPINKGLSAMQIFDREMKKGTISFTQFFEIFSKTIDQGALFGTTATEIGHGWNQVQEAMKTFITQLDNAFGGSNILAGALSGLSKIILGIAKNIDIVIGALTAMSFVLIVKNIGLIATGLWGVLKVLKLITLSLLRNPFTFIFAAVTGLIVTFRKEIDNLATALVRWVDSLKESLGWMYGFISTIAGGIKALTGTIATIGETPTKPTTPTGGPTPATDTGGGGGGTGTGTGSVNPLQQQFDTIDKQRKNVTAAREADLTTGKEYIKQLADVNKRYKDLMITQAYDLKSKPELTSKIKAQIEATQGAANAYEMANLSTQQAIDTHTQEIERVNAAYQAGDITLAEHDSILAQTDSKLKSLLVTHALEIKSYEHLRTQIDKLRETTGEAAEENKKNIEQEQNKNKILRQVRQQQEIVNKSLLAFVKIAEDNVGFLQGDRPLTQEAQGAWEMLKQGNWVGATVQTVASAGQSISELFGGKTRYEKKSEGIESQAQQLYATQTRNLKELYEDNVIGDEKYHTERAQIADQLQNTLEQHYQRLTSEQKKNIMDNIKELQDSRDWLAKQVDEQQKQNDQLNDMKKTLDKQTRVAEQQLAAERMIIDEQKKQLGVLTRERDAALMEARIQAQASHAAIVVGRGSGGTTATGGRDARPTFNINMNFKGDIGKAVQGELQSDETAKATLNTMYENAEEYGEFTGGRVA